MAPAAHTGSLPRPPLKWAGGKRWLVPQLQTLWKNHSHCRLVEPFCGGLGVALGLGPSRSLLNDINPHAINLYRWLQRGLDVTIEMRQDKALYYEMRERFNSLNRNGCCDSAEAAQLFWFLNRTGFNGLCRFNSKGEYNVPFGQHKSIVFPQSFAPYKQAFSGWDFSTGDFEKLKINSDDFIYADPPYDVQFTKYAKEDFGWSDQERLAQWLANLEVPVVLSNQATPRVLALYKSHGFKLKVLEGPRSISRTGDRTPAQEVLATMRI